MSARHLSDKSKLTLRLTNTEALVINKVILIGNLGQDPEVRTTQSGSNVAKLRVATAERRKDREGNWNDHTEWHSVVCFGRTAENVGQYCKKGKQLYIEGRLQTQKWQDRDGNNRYTTEVVADMVRFLGGRGEGAGQNFGGGGYTRGGGQSSNPAPQAPQMPYADDEEIPF